MTLQAFVTDIISSYEEYLKKRNKKLLNAIDEAHREAVEAYRKGYEQGRKDERESETE